jgi:hypothetical protein
VEGRLRAVNNLVLKDAEKEFAITAHIGFGIDGDEHTRNADFAAVRGEYETNTFVKGLKVESDKIIESADKLLAWLEKLP